jgi:hypothetical protein
METICILRYGALTAGFNLLQVRIYVGKRKLRLSKSRRWEDQEPEGAHLGCIANNSRGASVNGDVYHLLVEILPYELVAEGAR